MKWLVVFSHLRWNSAFQRPQQLMSRFSRDRQVLFVEEPLQSSEPSYKLTEVLKNVFVFQPSLPSSSTAFDDEQLPLLVPLLTAAFQELKITSHVSWLYTPMAVRIAKQLPGCQATVYDCMDELSLFFRAPAELVKREAELFDLADVVFTGGRSLYTAKQHLHENIHCFPSSVDASQFRPDHTPVRRAEPEDQAQIPHPRLGFFGVIDERIDLELLDYVATHRPEWSVVLLGSVLKINRQILPARPNLHFLGLKEHKELARYLEGWDVCLLPFALNDATRFISPTKTLEYMAGEKMIVSTRIQDVADSYSDCVYIADDHESFLQACERALGLPEIARARRVGIMRRVIAETSWDKTATSMDELISRAVIAKTSRASSPAASRQANKSQARGRKVGVGRTRERTHFPTIVIGAGPTGLSAAYHLGSDCLLLEQNERVGGWCKSIEENGFTFDFAGHIMFSNSPYVHEMYQLLLGDNVHWQDREAWVYSKGVFTRYPFQGALYGLPPEVIRECLVGAIEARFGSLREKPEAVEPKARGSVCRLGELSDCCGDGILESTSPLARLNSSQEESGEARNFEEFIYRHWGAGIAKHFAIPYNRKLWTVPLTEMETSWLGGRVPLPDLEEMIEGALRPVPKPMGPNARFGYPLRGGFQALMDGFLPHLRARLELRARVIAVSPSEHGVALSDGRRFTYDRLVSTMPLPRLVAAIGVQAPLSIQVAARRLRHVSIRCVHLGIGREKLTEKHWIYYPEDPVFHRIFVQGNASPWCNPKGGFGLTCEISYSPHKPLPCQGDDLIRRCIDDCRRVGLIEESDPIWAATQVDLPYAYVIYDHQRLESVRAMREWFAQEDILLAGRYSEWEYYNSDHAFLAGKKVADEIRRLDFEETAESRMQGA